MIAHILKLIWNKRGSNALMILEIFLSFLVLFAVLAYVFFNLEKLNTPIGFETKDKWMISLDNIYGLDSLEANQTMANLKQSLEDEDQIQSVSFGNWAVPFSGSTSSNGTDLNGFKMWSLLIDADLGLKETLNLNITHGRWFEEDDYNAAIPSVIVNSAFMDKFYPNKSMIDSTFLFDDPQRIVGVIDHYRYLGQFEEDKPCIISLVDYKKNQDHAIISMAANTPASYEEKLAALIKVVTKGDGSIIQNLEKRRINNSRQHWLMLGSLIFVCGFLCLNVAMGLFGVLWYNINKRKAEIGLRQALGAHGIDITKQFILEIIILTGVALAIGIFFAIQIPLLDVTEFEDALYYKSILYSSLIILSLVFICALFPSIQAAKITPANSLHED